MASDIPITVAGIHHRQRNIAIYEAIKKYWHTNHRSASMADIAAATGHSLLPQSAGSKSTVHRHVTALAVRGYITYRPNAHRTLTPIDRRPA